MNCRIAELPNCRIELLIRPLRLLRAALAEIFDEAAYARFLARTGAAPSRASYAEFLRENARVRERRPRCC